MKVVFFGPSGSIVKWAYKDVTDNPDITYCEYNKPEKASFADKLFIGSGKGNYLPFIIKDRYYKKHLKYGFLRGVLDKKKDFLFIFTCQYGMLFESGFFCFINYLKKKYRGSKFAFYYNDVIKTCEPNKFPFIKSNFDRVLTFDKKEAEKYGIEYYGIVHSKAEPPKEETAEESDVFYVGSDRGRFDDIIKAFTLFSDLNKRCVFYINEVLEGNIPKLETFLKQCERNGEAYLYKSSILYINRYCWYGKTLRYIMNTKCLFEVLLPFQTAGTLRAAESVMYGKKLITNFKDVINMPYFNSHNIFVYDQVENIDGNFLEQPYAYVEYDFSPLKMVEYLKTN